MLKNLELVPGNVKATMKHAGATSADLWQVDYDQLHILPGFNVRERDEAYADHVKNIAGLMVVNGYYRDKPMAGYVANINGLSTIVVTDGHCRYEAIPLARAQGAEIGKIPVIIKPSGTSSEDLTVALATSNSGKALSPYELGTVCKRLQSFGWDEKTIAGRLNLTPTYIVDLLFLQGCPSGVRSLVQRGQVSAGMAIAAVRKDGEGAFDALNGAVEKASSQGKKKATAKDLEPDWKREVKKAGPKLYEALAWVREDGGYHKLHENTRLLIDELMNSLPDEPQK